jgi:hypothetical protein
MRETGYERKIRDVFLPWADASIKETIQYKDGASPKRTRFQALNHIARQGGMQDIPANVHTKHSGLRVTESATNDGYRCQRLSELIGLPAHG